MDVGKEFAAVVIPPWYDRRRLDRMPPDLVCQNAELQVTDQPEPVRA
ncbi:MAG TPA: hypothetical protein VHU85_05865 [Acidimicrobiales bacterium]|jgi:hypothetical protein|nr:hypothetical protein [Acidimicrobiales bacterium]